MCVETIQIRDNNLYIDFVLIRFVFGLVWFGKYQVIPLVISFPKRCQTGLAGLAELAELVLR